MMLTVGLAELYQSVRTATLKQQRQPQLVSVFTTELFAYYLHIKYLSVTECDHLMQSSSTDELQRYKICISDTQQLLIADVLLFLSVRRLLNFQLRPNCLKPKHTLMNADKHNSSDLLELLYRSQELNIWQHIVSSWRETFVLQSRLSQQTLRRCTHTNVANISEYQYQNVHASRALVCTSRAHDSNVTRLYSVVGWWHCLTDCTNANDESSV